MSTLDADELERRQPARRTDPPGRSRTGGSAKGNGGVTLLVVSADSAFCMALARLAEAQHVTVSFFWSALDVERVPFWGFDAVILDSAQWLTLQRGISPRVAAELGRAPFVVVDGDLSAPELLESRFPILVADRVAKTRGVAVILDAALRAGGLNAAAADAASAPQELEDAFVAQPLPAAPRAGARSRFALIDVNRHYSDALWSAARERGLQLDLFADVAHFREHARDRRYGAVIVDFDPGALAGVDLEAALTASLGATPAVIVTPVDHGASTGAGASAAPVEATPARPFTHVSRGTSYDAVLDAAIELAGRTDLSTETY